jgi:hypothetical protein
VPAVLSALNTLVTHAVLVVTPGILMAAQAVQVDIPVVVTLARLTVEMEASLLVHPTVETRMMITAANLPVPVRMAQSLLVDPMETARSQLVDPTAAMVRSQLVDPTAATVRSPPDRTAEASRRTTSPLAPWATTLRLVLTPPSTLVPPTLIPMALVPWLLASWV